ncbi:MAG TPA: cupin domain-containing protein [Sphingobacteriaceae bacterium]
MKTTSLIIIAFLALALGSGYTVTKHYEEAESENTARPDTIKGRGSLKGFTTNIEKATIENNNYRKVLYTGKHMQLVLMSLKPGEEIGEETHQMNDQFFRFESGNGKCLINGTEHLVQAGDAVLVPAGAKHNVINTNKTKNLQLYAIYAIPVHKNGIVRSTKAEADKNEAKFDGKTTE